jgi:hypothetical protein
MSLSDLLITIIIAGIGLSIATLRADYVSRRGRNAKERRKAIVQRELHTNRLRLTQNEVPVAALGNHQHFLSKESGDRTISDCSLEHRTYIQSIVHPFTIEAHNKGTIQ